MNYKLFCLLAVSAFASACATDSLQVESQLEQVNDSLRMLELGLAKQYREICTEQSADLEAQLEAAQQKIESAEAELLEAKKQCDARIERSPSKTQDDRKVVLGAIENVYLIDEELSFEARIDSGAETSSLGVYGVRDFERDGKEWVRFKLENKKSAPSYEYRVNDKVRIKQSSADFVEDRFEIKMDIRVGEKKYRNQVFNLANRRNMEHQMLLGRNFLRDIAVVDVSEKHLLKKRK